MTERAQALEAAKRVSDWIERQSVARDASEYSKGWRVGAQQAVEEYRAALAVQPPPPVGSPTTEPTPDMGQGWFVTAGRWGDSIVTIEEKSLSGKPDFTPEDQALVRGAALHLLAFIGAPVPEHNPAIAPCGHYARFTLLTVSEDGTGELTCMQCSRDAVQDQLAALEENIARQAGFMLAQDEKIVGLHAEIERLSAKYNKAHSRALKAEAGQPVGVSTQPPPPVGSPTTEQTMTMPDVLQAFRNLGIDTECGACMAIAFTGFGAGEHTCKSTPVEPAGASEPPSAFTLGQEFVSRVTSSNAPEGPSVIGPIERDEELVTFALELAVATLGAEGCACQPEEPCALCMCKEAVAHLRDTSPAPVSPVEPTPEQRCGSSDPERRRPTPEGSTR